MKFLLCFFCVIFYSDIIFAQNSEKEGNNSEISVITEEKSSDNSEKVVILQEDVILPATESRFGIFKSEDGTEFKLVLKYCIPSSGRLSAESDIFDLTSYGKSDMAGIYFGADKSRLAGQFVTDMGDFDVDSDFLIKSPKVSIPSHISTEKSCFLSKGLPFILKKK